MFITFQLAIFICTILRTGWELDVSDIYTVFVWVL